MKLLQCCLYGLSLLVLPNISLGLPTSLLFSGSNKAQQVVEQQQPLPPLPTAAEYFVDLTTFSSSFSTHLLFDHIDGTLSILSKRISLHFQQLVQVTTQPFNINDDAFIVDIDLLKGQLQGAVGSFIEDSLPAIWNTRAAVIDKANLSYYIEQVTLLHCHQQPVLNTCIETNSEQIISTIDHYIQNHLLSIIHVVVREDLPPLFITTQNHVNGILTHFSHYLLLSKNKQKPTTTINNNNSSTTTSQQQQQSTPILMNHSFENSQELISHLESAVNLYHSSLEDSSSLKKYTLLARLED